jgi:hypothetical protein
VSFIFVRRFDATETKEASPTNDWPMYRKQWVWLHLCWNDKLMETLGQASYGGIHLIFNSSWQKIKDWGLPI